MAKQKNPGFTKKQKKYLLSLTVLKIEHSQPIFSPALNSIIKIKNSLRDEIIIELKKL